MLEKILIILAVIINFVMVFLAQRILIKKGYDLSVGAEDSPVYSYYIFGPLALLSALTKPKSENLIWQEKNIESHAKNK